MFICCGVCGATLEVVGPMHVWSAQDWTQFRCWKPACAATDIRTSDAAKVGDYVSVSPEEALRALLGGGLPEERACDATLVRQLLEGSPIVTAHTRAIRGSHRCAIDRLTLQNGVELCLAGSTNGAVVFRVCHAR